jgi:ElaB/YqjD/DUF883 family membrane-anchored ribosome-binding protein
MIRTRDMSRHGVGNEWEALRDDVTKLRGDLAGLAEALIQAGKQEAGEAKEKVEEEARRRLDGLRSAAEEVQSFGRKAVESVQERVGEWPVVSILLAFAVGVAIGKFMDRK